MIIFNQHVLKQTPENLDRLMMKLDETFSLKLPLRLKSVCSFYSASVIQAKLQHRHKVIQIQCNRGHLLVSLSPYLAAALSIQPQ